MQPVSTTYKFDFRGAPMYDSFGPYTCFRPGCYADGNDYKARIYGYGWPMWSWRFK